MKQTAIQLAKRLHISISLARVLLDRYKISRIKICRTYYYELNKNQINEIRKFLIRRKNDKR